MYRQLNRLTRYMSLSYRIIMKRADLLPCLIPLLTSVFLLNMTMAQDATISCHFTPANVTEGEGANLTCTFPVDIKENAKDFYVQMSNDTVFDINENVIVRCFWLNPPGPSPNCSMEKGYAKLIVEGNTVTMGIPDATTDQKGYYKCSMVNPGPDIERHPCVFSVAENSSSDFSAFPMLAIIVIVVGVVVVAVAVVVAVRCYRNNTCRICGNENGPASNGEDVAMSPNVQDLIAAGNARDERAEQEERILRGQR